MLGTASRLSGSGAGFDGAGFDEASAGCRGSRAGCKGWGASVGEQGIEGVLLGVGCGLLKNPVNVANLVAAPATAAAA